MDASVLKKTQDTLGKVIKKPPLTEKLLSKPPFRYLHDIITEVIRTTGFLKGLYGEAELKSENVKDKDGKIAFLQKAIDVVAMVSGEALAVRPVRVVAGHDAEKTNEFLQAVGRCCLNKLSSEDAVKRVLAGDKPDPRGKFTSSRSKDKENHEARERHREKEPKRDIKEQSFSRDRKESDMTKESESRRPEKDKPREAERTKDFEGKRPENDKPRETERRKESEGRRLERPRAPERIKERERSKDKSRDREKDKVKDRGRERDAHREKDRDRDREKRKERDRDRERRKDTEDRQKEPERAERKDRDPAEESNGQPVEQPIRNGRQDSEQESPARIPRPSSAKGQRQWPKAEVQDESDSDGGAEPHLEEKANQLENGDTVDSQRPQTAVSPNKRISRPSSARPAPPRVRRQESNSEGVPTERLGSTKPPSAVIMDGRKLPQDEEDDQQFVVEEAAPLHPDMPELEAEPDAELQGNEKHGGLVKKILETKKDYETSSSPKSKEQERIPVSQAAWKKERDLVSREMERLRASVQMVCRSALPLGKIIDYIQEDVDSMQAELQTWRRENWEHAQSLLEEQRITDGAVEPLKAELAQLEQLIREQQDKICAVKSNILRNKEKIHKIISSISLSTRT